MAGNQVAKQESTELAPKARNVALADYLSERKADFSAVSTIDPDKFLRVVKNALLRDPQISEASTQSVFVECMKAMQDGLVLDGREAVLTRFKTNKRRQVNGKWEDNWQTEVVYIPMMAGIMKRVRASGEISSWTVELVYAEEYKQGKFKYRAAPDPYIEHEPIIVGDRGEVVAAYSAVKLRDGTYHYEVMTRPQLESIKNRTKSKSKRKGENGKDIEVITGPWATDEDEMFRKTVIRRHSKRLPVSSEIMGVANRVDSLYETDGDGYDDGQSEEITVPRTMRRTGAAARVRKATQSLPKEIPEDEVQEDHEGKVLDGEIIDASTGEIIEGDTGAADPEDEF